MEHKGWYYVEDSNSRQNWPRAILKMMLPEGDEIKICRRHGHCIQGLGVAYDNTADTF